MVVMPRYSLVLANLKADRIASPGGGGGDREILADLYQASPCHRSKSYLRLLWQARFDLETNEEVRQRQEGVCHSSRRKALTVPFLIVPYRKKDVVAGFHRFSKPAHFPGGRGPTVHPSTSRAEKQQGRERGGLGPA